MPPPGFINLTIDPDAEEDFENKHGNLTVLDMINESIKNKEIRDLCLTVNDNIHTGDRSFILEVLKKGQQISARRGRAFMSSQSPVILGDLYVYRHNNQIIKIANCDCDQYIAEFDIVREIAMQQYASTLQTKCDFKVPLIINYGKVVLDDYLDFNYNCLYYFTMENITAKTLREYLATIDFDNTCTPLVKKINDIYDCLVGNNLYHNDYHIENIMVDTNKNINVIDYGLATDKQVLIEDPPYDCSKLKKIAKKGGKRKRTKKYYRKNKNTKTRRKK